MSVKTAVRSEFFIATKNLLTAMQLVVGVLERRQTLPILSHVLMQLDGKRLTIIATDLELELVAHVALSESVQQPFALTVPGRKLLDICRALPEHAGLHIRCQKSKVILKTDLEHGVSRFDLAMLPAKDFPRIAVTSSVPYQFSIAQAVLKSLFARTQFAMAQHDVRPYLNGILLEVLPNQLRTVATDGHRLAMSTCEFSHALEAKQVIVPRKAVVELTRFLSEGDSNIELQISDHYLSAHAPSFSFVSKLIDHRFPDYRRALPKGGDKTIVMERTRLKDSLSRTAILCNEKFRGIQLKFSDQLMCVVAHNPEQEVAEEKLTLSYDGGDFDIGFNVNYLLDALNHLSSEQVMFIFKDATCSVELRGVDVSDDTLYVVMPLRL
jgi:DNA polymerase III subunit beta